MEPGTGEVAVHTAGKGGHQELSVGYTADSVDHRTDLLVPAAVRTVLDLVHAAVHIALGPAVDQVDLKVVGILHNRHSAHQTDLAGHVPAVHTAVAGQVGEDQKVERSRSADQVGHRRVEHTGPIEV